MNMIENYNYSYITFFSEQIVGYTTLIDNVVKRTFYDYNITSQQNDFMALTEFSIRKRENGVVRQPLFINLSLR
jgi:hypothetical protein